MSRLKVIQIPFCFYPDPVGGTEVYVEALASQLQNRGMSVIVAAPGEKNCAYMHQEICVRRYELKKSITKLEELYGEGDAVAASNFGRLLDEEYPDVVHLHAFTRGVSLRIVKEAKSRGIPVVFTYHTPTVSCQRGTLLRWGNEICDGVLNFDTCARCTLNDLGVPRKVADLVGRTPVLIGNILGDLRLSGGIWTALRMRALMHIRQNIFIQLMSNVDYFVSLCRWGQELLVNNGVNKDKTILCRHGVYINGIHNKDDKFPELTRSSSEASDFQPEVSDLRIAFLGRLNYIKGAHIIVEALSRVRDLPVKFDIYGIIEDEEKSSYFNWLKSNAYADARINFRFSVPHYRVLPLLRNYDLLVVPSQWLETGPMVVLEAFAAGIPVIGSNLGGIAELVEHEVNGLLVKHDSIEEWSDVLTKLSKERDLLNHLRNGVKPPRSMEEVAEEMITIYGSICHSKNLRHDVSVKEKDNCL
jgi:glycosyltransferase involved in cell wall biosynthesis